MRSSTYFRQVIHHRGAAVGERTLQIQACAHSLTLGYRDITRPRARNPTPMNEGI
jgi:hypothetical protein